MKNWTRTAAILIGLVALIVALYIGIVERQEDFYYASPADLAAGKPGSLIRSERMDTDIEEATTWRVLYRSTGLNGEPVAVSGVVVVPTGDAPVGGFPVVAWAHPTTGIAQKCAPSLGTSIAPTIAGFSGLVKRGFVIAATDYLGLGTPGPHPYLVGRSAAHSVLDSVRTAGELTETSRRFAVWGHSQGGHAVLWAGQLATEYAPELTPAGIAAAAPATRLATLFEEDRDTPGGKAFSALALLSWSKVYGLDPATVIEPAALTNARIIGEECMTNRFDLLIDGWALHGLPSTFLKTDPTKAPPWSGIIAENTPSGGKPGLPVLILQGTRDSVVLPPVTRGFARGLCLAGAPVELVEMNADHLSVAALGADIAVQWMADRLSGKPSGGNCPTPAE
ncbi:hypothetical protein ATN84_07320 [Paramesorhizobium deserti]|uniref:Lipase n=1 Tax=Paramesorhizobium deserti TaxID=1494590 RepID=A0A135HVK1_9HYPH|nr:lipase family protein [Paramesorhizobium deserti]KXF77216.1 hypothetical protein ATN84_07320 [Paramesorhizobium deserti]